MEQSTDFETGRTLTTDDNVNEPVTLKSDAMDTDDMDDPEAQPVADRNDISALHRMWISRAKAIHGEPSRERKPFTKLDGTPWTDEEISRFKAWEASPVKGRARIGSSMELLGFDKPAAWPVRLLAKLCKAGS